MLVSRMKGVCPKGKSRQSPPMEIMDDDFPVKQVDALAPDDNADMQLLLAQLAQAEAQNQKLLQTIEELKSVAPVEVIKTVEVEKPVEVIRVIEKILEVARPDLSGTEIKDANLKLMEQVLQKSRRLMDILEMASAENKQVQTAIQRAAKAYDIQVLMAAHATSADDLVTSHGIENVLSACQDWIDVRMTAQTNG